MRFRRDFLLHYTPLTLILHEYIGEANSKNTEKRITDRRKMFIVCLGRENICRQQGTGVMCTVLVVITGCSSRFASIQRGTPYGKELSRVCKGDIFFAWLGYNCISWGIGKEGVAC